MLEQTVVNVIEQWRVQPSGPDGNLPAFRVANHCGDPCTWPDRPSCHRLGRDFKCVVMTTVGRVLVT
jgi:hypothetical protein